jgi:hypothetical protein
LDTLSHKYSIKTAKKAVTTIIVMTATGIRRYCIKVKPYLSFDTLVRHQKAKAVRNQATETIIIYM